MSRREQREHLFKLVFCKDFHDSEEIDEQFSLYFDQLEKPTEEEVKVIKEKFENLLNKQSEVDEAISGAAEGWQITRIGKAELAILRVAVYEIMFDETVPGKVAINEAVELAKKYCADSAPAFINGVLAKFINE